ncbi:zinc/manganese transport system substrate-binding protein [Nakamurella panacisegetis]|uniref:Zinc/manganese transport system substrate-binding protein n=1 Tax=Nakamurella panacisegetis TaxID=1090615 RepID=A0A1H0JF05_9ACTN|nr:zinc ABC transporter substrate-binding protein [Nakamurella panacisegetis]SDO42019.1 zinc/manganese transport system substrate-binding protein [Nakamurella panacisegetis]
MYSTAARVLWGLLLAATLAAAGCSSTSSTGSTGVAVVASTDVWGNIAAAIGGDKVTVTSIITDPAADPHSYEANAQNVLAVSKARLLIENGGGYDDFFDHLISSAGSTTKVLNAVKISGHTGTDVNEHVWYDFPTVDAVAEQIETALAAADPSNAATYAANTNTFVARVGALRAKAAAVKAKSGGVGVAITEPVPLYLLTACGLVDRTPAAFSQAVESDSDAPAAVVAQTLALFTGRQVKALVYNAQTTGPQTKQVLDAAKANNVNVVPVRETLPADTDYVSWMTSNLDAIAKAVA